MNVRSFKETDRDFIIKSVLFSFMNGSKEIQKINRDSYMHGHNKVLNNLLDKCDCLIACDPEDSDLIYGFVIFGETPTYDILHYIYVRKPFRKNAYAKSLLENVHRKNQLSLTHLTDDFKPARLKKYWEKVIFDRYLL